MKLHAMLLLLLPATNAAAQSVSYNHDATKMNQILVMETGGGSLTPASYYSLFHGSYAKTAATTNKLTYRSAAGINAYLQVPDAEAVDSAMIRRAEIEALNIADRTGGVLDLAWAAEGSKITGLLERFERNIERILPSGGTIEERDRWLEYCHMYQSAVKATREAYMPNAQRKKAYLRIYEDLTAQNEFLVTGLAQRSTRSRTRELLAATMARTSHKTDFIRQAKTRWKSGGQSQNLEDNEE